MNKKNSDIARERTLATLMEFFAQSQDVGQIASGTLNMPYVADDGEEGWIEIVVKIPKEDEGYDLREEYKLKCEEKAEKAKVKAEEKAAKMKADAAKRAEKERAKAKAKEEKGE